MVKDDDIRRVEIHDIAFATPHICRICGGRIVGTYLAEIHTGGVVTFRCLSHTGGLAPTVHEGKLGQAEEQGQMVRRAQSPLTPSPSPPPATSLSTSPPAAPSGAATQGEEMSPPPSRPGRKYTFASPGGLDRLTLRMGGSTCGDD